MSKVTYVIVETVCEDHVPVWAGTDKENAEAQLELLRKKYYCAEGQEYVNDRHHRLRSWYNSRSLKFTLYAMPQQETPRDPDADRGLYQKFSVERRDGQSLPGEKHHNCQYFVLDLTHDEHAIPALAAYVLSCEETYPLLANDLRRKIQEMCKLIDR